MKVVKCDVVHYDYMVILEHNGKYISVAIPKANHVWREEEETDPDDFYGLNLVYSGHYE